MELENLKFRLWRALRVALIVRFSVYMQRAVMLMTTMSQHPKIRQLKPQLVTMQYMETGVSLEFVRGEQSNLGVKQLDCEV
jgi:hypothetical protein